MKLLITLIWQINVNSVLFQACYTCVEWSEVARCDRVSEKMSQVLQNKIMLPLDIELNLNPEGDGNAKFCFTEQELKIYANEEQLRCDLGRSEFRLLLLLTSDPDKVFSKSELIDFAWAGRVVSEGSLTHAIFNLRSFFWRCGKDVFVTAPRAGYYFNSKYLPASTLSPSCTKELDKLEIVSKQTVPAPNLSGSNLAIHSRRRRTASFGLVAVLLLVTGGVWLFNSDSAGFLIDEHVTIERLSAGEATINIVGDKYLNPSLNTQHDYLVKQIRSLSSPLKGEVWLSYTKARFRIACFTTKGATTYAAPLTVSLKEVLSKCLSI
jgi:DNA-binding winged helix-turn-helix (wHTH) protein